MLSNLFEDVKIILIQDLPKNEISISMRNLWIFFERSHEDFMKKKTIEENKRRSS